ncbi:MAG: CHAD domain-containing protein [Bryobacteraceae bacterium]|nr:CHAD domain-containing protein [Bryobacteraceae bacterium]
MTARREAWERGAAEFARLETEARMGRFFAELERATRAPDEEAVHDLRVSIRRFSQALRIFAPLLPGKAVKKIRGRMKVVMDAAAVVRDLDVGMEALAELGVEAEDQVVAQMRADRRRGELFLLGQVCLLRAEDLEGEWRARLGWSEAG